MLVASYSCLTGNAKSRKKLFSSKSDFSGESKFVCVPLSVVSADVHINWLLHRFALFNLDKFLFVSWTEESKQGRRCEESFARTRTLVVSLYSMLQSDECLA